LQGFAGKNTPAYFPKASAIKKKVFKALNSYRCVIKLLSFVTDAMGKIS
jgi:hypothetical protein